ncbi:MAG: MaoC family dehydratase [Chloroflexi bacterium]|nr:MAG: MaoC family dehydratase [Chloroflexota bacterium]
MTGRSNYFEDFSVGDRFRHARGTTIGELENQLLTKLVMNTAQAHFNEHAMKDTPWGQRLVFGLVTGSIVMGLATQDVAENAVAELRLDKLRFTAPVFHGDTLYAYTEVLSKTEVEREDAGEVTFRHWGVNQEGRVVFEGERTVLVRRRNHRVKQ